MKKAAIPGVGWVVKFLDPEGNLACAVHYDPAAK
jgi:predicted enzyme related to lactoylglutathione lyase